MDHGGELKRQALGGAFWSTARFGAEQVFRFAVFAFLARVLSPTDFGVFALATIFVDVGKVLSSAGLAEAMIQAKNADDELADTIFWAAFALTGVIALALGGLSVPIAMLLQQPSVAPVILALSACLMFGPLTLVHSARATRAFRNKALTAIAVFTNFVSGASAVIAAYQGLGLWSFVISQVVYGAVSTALIWMAFPWAPRLSFSRRRLGEVGRFSGHMVFAQLITATVQRAQDFITGRFLGPASLGQLRIAGRVFEVINQALITPLAAIALPTLSRLQDDPQGFRNAYSRMLALSCIIACPAGLGFAAVSADAIPLLFGDQWTQATRVVQILGLAAPAWVLAAFVRPALAARGRSDTIAHFAWLQLVAVTGISLVAVQFGLVVLAAASVARVYLVMPLQLRLFTRATGLRTWDILRNIVPPAAASMAMAGVLMLVAPYVRERIGEPILRLALMVPLGAALYGLVLVAGWRRFVLDQVQGVRSALASRRGA